MRRWPSRLLTLLVGSTALVGSAASAELPVVNADSMAFVDQGWTPRQREAFWFTSQGSQILSYDIFVNLEQAGSEAPFRAPEHMAGLGYIPWPATARNPDALPIGFVRDDQQVGLTCAACHTNVVRHDRRDILIDGAPTLADLTGFMTALVDAMRASQEGAKFQRLATRMLGSNADPAAGTALLARLRAETDALAGRVERNSSNAPYGHGRLDAFGQIFNEVTSHDLGVPENARPADAPVSYPFLWGTPQSDKVQWNGVAENEVPLGSLTRNVSEVLGVFGRIEMGDGLGYPSSVRLRNLAVLENHVERLWRPDWEDAGLPALDAALTSRGAEVYKATCSECHAVLDDPTARSRRIVAQMLPLEKVETDPAMARRALDMDPVTEKVFPRRTGRLEGRPAKNVRGEPLAAMAPSLAIVGNAVAGTLLANLPRTFEAVAVDRLDILTPGIRPSRRATATSDASTSTGDFEAVLRGLPADASTQQRLDAYDQAVQAARGIPPEELLRRLEALVGPMQGGEADDPRRLLAYKARPLDGIWATAPYLHNGSVPTLADLLLPPDQRPDRFRVGSRQLDTARVGFVSSLSSVEGTVLDTDLPGNANAGHGYGTTLPEEDKVALVEYLKSL